MSIVFLSHAADDREIANALHAWVKQAFGGAIDIRHASADDPADGIPPGLPWLEWIHERIAETRVMLVLLTPLSAPKPWPVWEAGALQGINLEGDHSLRIIPVLVALPVKAVPSPLAPLMAVRGDTREGMDRLFDVLFEEFSSAIKSPRKVDREQATKSYIEQVTGLIGAPHRRLLHDGAIQALDPGRFNGLNPYILSRIARAFRELAAGQYYVRGVPEVYRHDSEALQYLGAGDFYYATHPVTSNPDAMSGTIEHTAAFANYVSAQVDASKRGVRVKRLYVIPDYQGQGELSESVRKHLDRFDGTGVEVRLCDFAKLDPDPQLRDDIVLIGNECLGVGVPSRGPMQGSLYCIDGQERTNNDHARHLRYFEELWNAAVPYGRPSPSSALPILATAEQEQPANATQPAFVLETPVSIDGRSSRRLMVVLRTNGCHYDTDNKGCTMCDFKRHALKGARVEPVWLEAQLEAALQTVRFGPDAVEQVDLLTLGSFLHDREVPGAFRKSAFDRFRHETGIRKVVIESRTPYVTRARLDELREWLRPDQCLELGIGVETTNERLRQEVIRKGMSNKQLERAVNECAQAGIHFQAYLLIGTPSLTEGEVVTDAVNSAQELSDLCGRLGVPLRIAFEPVFITHDTELETAFENGEYRLVNLWKVVEVLRETHHLGPVFVGMSDEGLSDNRLPAGCPECTPALRDAIATFNGTQDIGVFDGVSCACH